MRIGCFVESYNFKFKEEAEALQIFVKTAKKMGHELELVGKEILRKMDKYDSIFIRATTDPLLTAFVVSRLAEEMGKNVIDDSESIRICSDKISLHYKFQKNEIPTPKTILFFGDYENLEDYAEQLGYPVVVKKPNSRFSLYVEKANNYEELLSITKKFMRKCRAVLLQEYIPTNFDWRIGVLRNKLLYACKYVMAKGAWKIHDIVNGRRVYCDVKAVKVDNLSLKLKNVALKAAKSVGDGLYGIDIKEVNGKFYVIEVNDNPSIGHGWEDRKNPELYEEILIALTET
ncbi:MAG: RimK family alpha-L-glutamate ligase [Archaeoglobaceae archaeon]|nr:RimK family alpha-L-glutamate ligase [Archaeoglobaceae archaeon]MCX8151475.1 RimK family alpha-L-glutamate ligase [Archaeoglobaceae archaeon]MDW8014237.1 RimK family alpha-L-glutamate ligase [Archaeoglobaceae archaeon]